MNINEAALRHLSNRSRTVAEMEKHLKQKGFGEEEIKEVIAEFKDYGYLNDSRYCSEYFRYAFGKGKGKRKVFQELREKGVDSACIEIAFDDFDAEYGEEYDERTMAREEAAKVLRMADFDPESGEPVPEKIIGRIGRKLQSKGYGSDIIYSVIGELRK